MKRALAFAGLPLALAGVAVALPAMASPDGASIFTRCAACHTRTGAGVPGAYPPLGVDFRTVTSKPAGRRYVALAVIRGLTGPLTVEGKAYRGVMPAQAGLDDAAVAAVLNHVGTVIAKAGPVFKAFDAAEVAGYRSGGAALSPSEVVALHAGAGGK